jgi:peptidoglycan/LPS O-acetylase OafA/YrhL
VSGATPASRLVSIDILRGWAVLAVVAEHISNWAPGGWRQHPFFFLGLLFEYGYLGVPMFIVISGFCIHLRTSQRYGVLGEYRVNWLAYWSRRTFRLYPPYAIAIALSLVVAAWLGWPARAHQGTFSLDLTTHLLMLHDLTAQYATGLGNGAFWSLGTEEQLYLLYLLLIPILRSGGWRRAVLIGFVTSVLWRVFAVAASDVEVGQGAISLGSWHFWPFKFWLLWILGALAVDHYHGHVRLPRVFESAVAGISLMAAGLALNMNLFEFLAQTHLGGGRFLRGESRLLGMDARLLLHQWGEVLFGFACFVIVNRLSRLERTDLGRPHSWLARSLASVGKASYSIYLTHVPVLRVVEHVTGFGFGPWGWAARHLVSFAAALGVGAAFYWLVERWFLRRPKWLPLDQVSTAAGGMAAV